MGTLTIRTTEEQDQLIEQVQKLLGESAVSKTLLRCVSEYQELLARLETTRSELKTARDRVNELERIIFDYQHCQNALMKVTHQNFTPKPHCASRLEAKQAIERIKVSILNS